MTKKLALIYCICMIVLSGCSSSKEQVEISDVKQIGSIEPAIADKAELKVENFEEVTDAVAFSINGELLVAFKVKQFDRFRLKSIEKKVQEKLENEFPSKKTTVSSDLKIFIETSKLKDKQLKNGLSKKHAYQDFTKIVKLSEEQT